MEKRNEINHYLDISILQVVLEQIIRWTSLAEMHGYHGLIALSYTITSELAQVSLYHVITE